MRLLLVQHGEAKPTLLDPQKPLTDSGRDDVRRSGKVAAKMAAPAEILHSGKLRAQQTAELLAAALKAPARAVEGLAPEDPVEPWKIRLAAEERDVMLVGHLPFMERLASALLTGDAELGVVRFQRGGVVCLEREGVRWRLLWAVLPEHA